MSHFIYFHWRVILYRGCLDMAEPTAQRVGSRERKRHYWLSAAREKAGLSLEDVAERTGIPPDTLTGYEQGKRKVPPAVVDVLSTAYGPPPAQIADEGVPTAVRRTRRLRANLVKLRQATGLRLTEFAERLGIAAGTWSKYEAGSRRLTPSIMRLMAMTYGVEPHSIVDDGLRDVRGKPLTNEGINEFMRLPYEARKRLVFADADHRIVDEAGRLVRAAHAKAKIQRWIPEFHSLFKRMALELDVPPPIELSPTDWEQDTTA